LENKSFILDELMGSKNGGMKSEADLFNELLKFEESVKKENRLQTKNVIEFNLTPSEPDIKLKEKVILAADDLTKIKSDRKSDFIMSQDGKFAIKYTKKLNEEIHLSILSETENLPGEVILYSPELKKYFSSNSSGEFIIGQYSNFDLKLFNFQAIFPFDKIMIIAGRGKFSAVSYNGYTKPKIIDSKDSHLNIIMNSDTVIKTSLLLTDKTKDFTSLSENIVSVPKLILPEKSILYLY